MQYNVSVAQAMQHFPYSALAYAKVGGNLSLRESHLPKAEYVLDLIVSEAMSFDSAQPIGFGMTDVVYQRHVLQIAGMIVSFITILVIALQALWTRTNECCRDERMYGVRDLPRYVSHIYARIAFAVAELVHYLRMPRNRAVADARDILPHSPMRRDLVATVCVWNFLPDFVRMGVRHVGLLVRSMCQGLVARLQRASGPFAYYSA